MTPKLFSELNLSPELLKAIDKLGFEQAAPIQAEAIPVLMQGTDVVGQSQTGSGKTAAFAIPAIEKTDPLKRVPQVLILCPTRELAVQVSEEVHKLALFKRGITALPIYGGQSYERQFYGLKQGAQIVIGTPGRVMDHMRRGTLRLETIKMVILDEVDVMLNMGFRDDIELILQSTPKERQTVFFSATIPRPIQQLIEKYSRDPKQVRIEQKALTVPTVEQVYYEVDRRYKIELLTRLIDIHDLKLGIIFCNTKRMVDDLVDHLEAQGYMADRLHGDMNQAQRDRVMNKFRKSGLEFLVATDIAARGIDVDDVQVVFNYDLPYDVEDYVHRIGRTGRAGRSGRAISFVAGREMFQIYNIERFTKMKIQRGKPPTADEVEDARANVFLDKVRATLQNSEFKREDHLIERLLEEGFSSTDIASALLHHLRVGDGGSAPKAPREEERPRPERAYREERPERYPDRHDRRSQFENRRDERRGPSSDRRERSSDSAPAAARPSVRAVPAKPVSSAPKVTPPAPAVPVQPPAKVKPEVEKTFSDKEILASVSEPPKKIEAKPAPKPSRRTPDNQTRLWMNVGEEMGVAPIDIVNAIAGETGLPGKVVGTVDMRERHLFADVASEHVKGIIAKLNRSEIKGHKLKVKVA
ncbi:MAG TPA: DEAD/DEAH box helicase [Verrucomicrobiae bacterium]|jgi:ATP-dependent RNA helicase DeaD|nr:DEAD/DEAH box helicase [Verrucomicrobiae bacterium]